MLISNHLRGCCRSNTDTCTKDGRIDCAHHEEDVLMDGSRGQDVDRRKGLFTKDDLGLVDGKDALLSGDRHRVEKADKVRRKPDRHKHPNQQQK